MLLNITQEVNPERSFVMGRNGLWKMKALNIWQAGDGRVIFACISRRGLVLNGGFKIDGLGFEQLVLQLGELKSLSNV